MNKTETLNKKLLDTLPTDSDRVFICELINDGWTFTPSAWMDQRTEEYLDVVFKSPRMKRPRLIDQITWRSLTRQKLWDYELDCVADELAKQLTEFDVMGLVKDYIRGELGRFDYKTNPELYQSTEICAAPGAVDRAFHLKLQVG